MNANSKSWYYRCINSNYPLFTVNGPVTLDSALNYAAAHQAASCQVYIQDFEEVKMNVEVRRIAPVVVTPPEEIVISYKGKLLAKTVQGEWKIIVSDGWLTPSNLTCDLLDAIMELNNALQANAPQPS